MYDPQDHHNEDHLEEDDIAGAGGEQHPHHAQDSGEGTLTNYKI